MLLYLPLDVIHVEVVDGIVYLHTYDVVAVLAAVVACTAVLSTMVHGSNIDLSFQARGRRSP